MTATPHTFEFCEVADHLDFLFRGLRGYVEISRLDRPAGNKWAHRFFRWPKERQAAIAYAKRAMAEGDVYCCPYPMKTEDRAKGHSASRHVVHIDIDKPLADGLRDTLTRWGFRIVASGTPGHLQAFARLSRSLSLEEHGGVERALRDHFGGDAKVSDNDRMRIPGGVNHKPEAGGGRVETLSLGRLRGPVDADKLIARLGPLPALDAARKEQPAVKVVPIPDKLPGVIRRLMREESGDDRSDQAYKAVCTVAEKGFSRDQVHAILVNYGPGVDKWDDRWPDQIDEIFYKWEAREKTTSPEEGSSRGRLKLVKASSFRLKRVQWGWQDRMPVGELCLIPGREGSGKSMFLAWMTAQITRGTLPGIFQGTPRPVAYVANEDAWEYTIAPRMIAAGADLDMVYNLEASESDDVGLSLSLPRDCSEVGELLTKMGAAALMLDPIVSVIDDAISVNQSRELRQALEPLRRMAEHAQVMVPALAHFNKAGEVDVLSKIPGARAWSEVARAAIGIAEDQEAGHYVASQIKNNLGRLDLPHLTYTIESTPIDTDEGATDVGRLVWGEESDTSVQEIMSRKPERRGREASDTTHTIKAHVLASRGPLTITDVQRAFSDINPDTVARTLRRLADRGELGNPSRGLYGRARE